jgi:hypothetical protein
VTDTTPWLPNEEELENLRADLRADLRSALAADAPKGAHDIPLVDDPNSLGVIYISGPMSSVGPPTWNKPAFNAKAAELRAQGYTVINPAEYDEQDGMPWDWYLRRDLVQLVKCGKLVLLDGWMDSKGAKLERDVAEGLGMEIEYP